MAPSACGCLWPREPLSHVILCSVISVTISKCTHVTLHTGAIHSPEPQVALCQVPENKVPFTLLLSISSSQRALREKKFPEFIAGELRLKTSETTVLRAQSFNHGVNMYTWLWSLCAHLHAWTSPMVIFLSPRTCWGRGHSLLVKQMRFTNKSMLPPPDIHSTHLSFGWWVTCTEMHCLHLTPVEFIIEILLILL